MLLFTTKELKCCNLFFKVSLTTLCIFVRLMNLFYGEVHVRTKNKKSNNIIQIISSSQGEKTLCPQSSICRILVSGQSPRSIWTLYGRLFVQIIMVGFFSYPNVLVNPRIYNAPNFIEYISLSPKKKKTNKIQQTANFYEFGPER